MECESEEQFSKAEEVFNKINEQISFNKLITPLNYKMENNKFKEQYLLKKVYNPQYKYYSDKCIDFDCMYKKLAELSFPDNEMGKIYSKEKEITFYTLNLFEKLGDAEVITSLGKKINGTPNIKYIKKAKETLNLVVKDEKKDYTADELFDKVKKYLDSYSFNWKISILQQMPAKVSINPTTKTIYINGKQKFSMNDIKRLCVHEISTHVLRSENGELRKYDILKRGTPNVLPTEEGLALYNEDISGTMNEAMLKLYAARFLSCINMDSMSFYEMVQQIEPFIGLDNAIYVVARIKIGLEDTSQFGGFIRDYAYFQGYIDIKNAIELDNTLYQKLYYGSISLKEIDILNNKIKKAINDGDIILPNFDIEGSGGMSSSINCFENMYQNLKQRNKEGWNPEEISQSMFEMASNILKRDNISSGNLLDLGCGDGKLTIKFAKNGFEVYGIDISQTAVAWAEERSKAQSVAANFKVGSVLDLPYEPQKFDVIIDSFCFHCIIGEDRKKFLSEAFRVLKNNGILIIMTKCGNPKDSSYPFDPVTRCKVENGVPTRYMGLPENIVTEIKNEGFKIIDYQVFNYEQDLLVVNAVKMEVEKQSRE